MIQEKDTDEVKGIFADTNMALLMVTFAVSAVHLLFDFLAFKNDISFWKGRTNMVSITHNVPEFDFNIFNKTLSCIYENGKYTFLLF